MSNYRVALVNPKDKYVPLHSYAITEHLGLGYLAAYLRQKGIEVKIIDGDVENLDDSKILEEVLDFEPDMVGLTGLIRTIGDSLKIANEIRRHKNDIFIFTGGQHATYAAEEILLNFPSINCVIRGEGEITLLEVITYIREGRGLQGILGVYYMQDGKVIKNPDRPAIEDLDILPFPARDSMEKCISQGRDLPVISILTSRGCSGGCSFCNSATYFSLGGGKHWRSRSPKNVVDEIEYLVKTYKTDRTYWVIHIYDDNFIGPGRQGRERAKAIALEMIARGLKVPFDIFCRVDSFTGDDELLPLLKKAGMVSAFIGLESGMPDTLKLYNKGTTPEQNIEMVKLMERYNIATPASGFIMFHPYASFDELRSNAKFLLSIGQATFWNLSVSLILFRGTKLVEKVAGDNLLGGMIHYWAAYDYKFLNPAVEPLAKAMDFSNNNVMIRLDSSVRYVENMMCKLEEQLEAFNDSTGCTGRLAAKGRAVKGELTNIQQISVEFFLNSVSLAEKNNMAEFPALKNKFIDDIDAAIDDLNSMFVDYINMIESEVA